MNGLSISFADFIFISFICAIAILLAIIIRKLGMHVISKKILLFFWVLICTRLLLPFQLPIDLRLDNFLPEEVTTPTIPLDLVSIFDSDNTAETNIDVDYDNTERPDAEEDTTENAITNANSRGGITSRDFSFQFWYLWLAGASTIGLYFIVAHRKFKKDICDALPARDVFVNDWIKKQPPLPFKRNISVKISDKITSPLIYGVFNHVILLPKKITNLNERKLGYVLAHEYMHARRFDCLLKLLFTAALCLHWFNPLVWIMYILANRDVELACDEAVLAELDPTETSNYALTLIELIEHRMKPTTIHAYFSKNGIEERIKAMMMRKRSSFSAAIVSILLVGCPMITFIGGGSPEDEPTDEGLEEEIETIEDYTEEVEYALKEFQVGGIYFEVIVVNGFSFIEVNEAILRSWIAAGFVPLTIENTVESDNQLTEDDILEHMQNEGQLYFLLPEDWDSANILDPNIYSTLATILINEDTLDVTLAQRLYNAAREIEVTSIPPISENISDVIEDSILTEPEPDNMPVMLDFRSSIEDIDVPILRMETYHGDFIEIIRRYDGFVTVFVNDEEVDPSDVNDYLLISFTPEDTTDLIPVLTIDLENYYGELIDSLLFEVLIQEGEQARIFVNDEEVDLNTFFYEN